MINNIFNINFVAPYIMFKRSAGFPIGSTKSSSRRPPGVLLGTMLGSLGGTEGENVDFHLFRKGLAGNLPRGRRQQLSEPEPWRGIEGGINPMIYTP